jgi:beta-galactosidase
MRNLSLLLTLLIALLVTGCKTPSENLKIEVPGVKNPVISLNGTWKFSMEPTGNFWENETDFTHWADILVPGECQMQGFAIQHDRPYAYKQVIRIPGDYRDKQVLLNFYGVYSYARVWVNGEFIRDHFGGFTKWSCDITDHVKAGSETIITVEVTDRTDDISYGSGYAKHQIGGILRDVELAALPRQNFKKLFFDTRFDGNPEHGELTITYELTQPTPASIRVELYDDAGQLLTTSEQQSTEKAGSFSVQIENPLKWDAEHPHLYKVVTILSEDGKEIMRTNRKIGFREVSIEGNKLLVNGKQVKLRGADRHDIHPLLGRMTTPEYDLKDVLLAKEANMNFIRTSHYPPSESFLEYCDQYGIYVEDETAVCFVGSHRTAAYRASGASQNDPAYRDRYLSQLEEMVQNHRNHPSVIIWSIGNENVYGENFVESYKWVKENDPSRPVIYSYPGQVPDSAKIYEILSMHYPNWRGNLTQYGITTHGFGFETMPALHDEWAHVACYNNFELKEDPNVRNFWGQSLDSMWTNLFNSDGGLGGAIWCMLDETFMLPEDLPGFNQWWGILDPDVIPASYMGPCVGYGEWGIIDTWRRKKPEFWNTKKAYSPAKIYEKQLDIFTPGEPLNVPVHNRFDHTNFSELRIAWKYGDKAGTLENVNIEPHAKGVLTIPANDWNPAEKLNLIFFQNDTFLVDEYNLQLGDRIVPVPALKTGRLKLNEASDLVTLSGNEFNLQVNKTSGLLENVIISGDTLIRSGPHVNLKFPGKRLQYSTIEMQDYAQNWKCNSFSFHMEEGNCDRVHCRRI